MTPTLANFLAAGAFVVALLAELWHARRVRRLGRLTFGAAGPPALWWTSIPLRVLGLTAATWGAATLLALEPRRLEAQPPPPDDEAFRRLLIVLDVSPSMHLADAGPAGAQTRSRRAGEVMLDVLRRVALSRCKASVVAFYTDAKPVAVDVTDLAVLENIFRDLPLDQAFEPGPSELFKGLESAFALAKDWPEKSATLVIVSDGDVAPATGMPAAPPSIADALVIGVGNPTRGTFIAGRQSRQDGSAMRQLASRLGGTYADCNVAPLPAGALAQLGAALPLRDEAQRGRRELALVASIAGGTAVALVPVGLAFAVATRRASGRMGRDGGGAFN